MDQMMRLGRSLALTAMAISALSMPAAAAEYCVTCANPPAMYRCAISGTASEPGSDPGQSLACIQQLATAGKHETCLVSKSAPFPCPGELRTIEAQLAPPPPPPQAEGDAAKPTAPPPNAVPRTVEELAKQTVEQTKTGIEKAGEAVSGTVDKAGEATGKAGSAIGNAMKKTWDCLSTLFTGC